MLLHLSSHSAPLQAAFCEKSPTQSVCPRCGQIVLESGAKVHARCMVPLAFSAPDGTVETDQQRDDRFSGQFLASFDGSFFRQMDQVLTDEIVECGDYHTITHPSMDPSLRGWVAMGCAKLLAAMANPALSKAAQNGAHKLLEITPALLFHTSRRMPTQSQSRAASLAMKREQDDNAKLWLLRRVPELLQHMLSEQAALKKGPADVDPAQSFIAAVRQAKFTPATEVLSSVADQRQAVQMMPTAAALPELKKAYSAKPAPRHGRTDGKALPDVDKQRLQSLIDSIDGPLITGRSFKAGLAGIAPGKPGGATSAKREHWEFIIGDRDELCQQFASTIDRAIRCGVRGLPGSTPFGIAVRDMLCGKPTFALTKPGKPGEGRSVSPPSALSKAIWNAVLAPCADMLRDFLAPSQVGFQTSDGSCAFALTVQAAMDMTVAEFNAHIDKPGQSTFSKQTIAVLFDIVKMCPRVRRRFVYDQLMMVIDGSHPTIKLTDSKLPATVRDVQAWKKVMFAFLHNYGSPIVDWHKHDDSGLITALISNEGTCIGQRIAGIIAFLGFQFLISAVEATTPGKPAIAAKIISYADNGAVVGRADDVIQLFRRMVEYSTINDIAEFQEIVVLRTTTDDRCAKTSDRQAINASLRKDVVSLLTASYCGRSDLVNPTVLNLLTCKAAKYCCDGIETVGIPVGAESFRRSQLMGTARIHAHELKVLTTLVATDPHAATAYVWRSFMHRWVSRIKSQPIGIIARPAALIDESLALFFSCQTDFNRSKHPDGLHMSKIQKLLLRVPTSSGGIGVINLVDRCDAASYAIGVLAMLTFVKKTGCQYLQRTVSAAVCQAATQDGKRQGQTMPLAYRAARQRRMAVHPKGNVLPTNPKKLM